MSDYVLGLFQDEINKALEVQHRIDEIEAEEKEIQIKINVLMIAKGKAIELEDQNGFISQCRELQDKDKKLKEEKAKKQDLHKTLVRKISVIQEAIEELEKVNI